MARSSRGTSPTGTGSGVLAVRLHYDGLKVEEIETPSPDPGEVLVRVHAAAITRDELEWPVDRLPAIPSYELSGVVIVEPDHEQLLELRTLVDAGELRAEVDSVFPLTEAQAAFERVAGRGPREAWQGRARGCH